MQHMIEDVFGIQQDTTHLRRVADDSFKALQKVPEALREFAFVLLDVPVVGQEDRTLAVLKQKGTPGPSDKLLRELVEFYMQHVRVPGQNLNRRDCADVAQNAIEYFSKRGFLVETKSLSARSSVRMFFEHFDHHIFNLFIGGDNEWMLVDLTAGHTIDADQGNYDVLVVSGDSEAIVEQALSTFYKIDAS